MLRQLACRCTHLDIPGFSRPRTYVSLRRRTPPSQLVEEVEPPLPRYLRRQQLTKSNDTPAKGPYRSKYLDPAREKADKTQIKFLEPHVLSVRLKKLCDASKIDEAVTMLKNAPLDAQNTQVWNTLIWECMKAKRFKLGYQLFVDMKRRGFSPTSRTFQTMFAGLSRIEDWASHTKQLANARSIYSSYQGYMVSVQKEDPDSPELSVKPLASYIKILGDAGCYQEIFDVYYAMDQEGRLAPDQFIFTSIFQALGKKPVSGSARDIAVTCSQNATAAKLLWTQMQKVQPKNAFEVDAFVVSSAISALSRGGLTEQTLAFSIIQEYYGLAPPDSTPTVGRIALVPQSAAAIFVLCNVSKKFDYADAFFQQIKKRSEDMGGVSVLDRAHLEEILKVRLSSPEAGAAQYCLDTLEWMLLQEIVGKNGSKIRPALSTYNIVLSACWRDTDWKSALRTFELMTGYHAHDFMDGSVSVSPRLDNRGPGRSLIPNPESLSAMVQTALASRDRANVRQCLRIVDHLDAGSYFKPSEKKAGESNKVAKNRAFFISKFGDAIVNAVDYIFAAAVRTTAAREETNRWTTLARLAKQASPSIQKSKFLPTA